MGINNPKPMPDTTIVKAADETVNNSNVLQNDDELTVSLGVGRHRIRTIMLLDGTASADFKINYSSSQSIYVHGWAAYFDAAGAPQLAGAGRAGGTSWSSNFVVNGPGAGNAVFSFIADVVVEVATACTFTIQWAQQNAEVSDSKVLAGSKIECWIEV